MSSSTTTYVLGTFVCLAVTACGQGEVVNGGDDDKEVSQAAGLVENVTSSSLDLPTQFSAAWQASTTLIESEEGVFEYRIVAGAADASDDGTGFTLVGAMGTQFDVLGEHQLPSWDTIGMRNQVNLRFGGEQWTSTSGTLSITSFQDGVIEGFWDASLVDVETQTQTTELQGSFSGLIGVSCQLLEPGPTWQAVGPNHPDCAALLD
jgi:hypothetical protein